MDEKIKYWFDISEYDLETAKAMLSSKRYLYVGFMCHQAIEKAFKALFVKNINQAAPHTHSLSLLSKKAGFYEELSESDKNFID